MPISLTSLDYATAALHRAADVVTRVAAERSQTEREVLQAGLIQSFEFTYEVAWKTVRRQLAEDHGHFAVDGLSRRELFRLAHQRRLIDDVDL